MVVMTVWTPIRRNLEQCLLPPRVLPATNPLTLPPTLSVQQPTVSASSSSFSWPARSASLSMKYSATAIWRLRWSELSQSAS